MSRKNPLAVHLKKLGTSREYRDECGEFLCDGRKLLLDAVRAGTEITAVLTTSPEAIIPEGARACLVDRDLIDSISPLKTPQDTLFSCRIRESVFDSAPGVSILLDGVQDPGNVGTVIRTANAFGIKNVILSGVCADPYNPKTVRATMGAVFRQKFGEMTIAEISVLAESGTRIIGAALSEGCADLRDIDLGDAIIAIGSEGQGLSDGVLSLCREFLKIPISPECESLNAAVAASVIMWEATKRYR